MAAPHAAARARLEGDEDLSAPAFDPADAESALLRRRERRLQPALRQAPDNPPLQFQRFEGFFEPHDDARRDVAVSVRGDFRLQLAVGGEARENTRVDGDATRPRCEPDHA